MINLYIITLELIKGLFSSLCRQWVSTYTEN